MFGFLKGKSKSNKNYPNQDVNGRNSHSKDKNKKQSKDKKDRQKSKPNDARDASQPSNSFFKKGGTLPPHPCTSPQNLSNGLSSYSCASLDQISSGDQQNTTSEVSDICSKSSSCRNSVALSASSSRASIPSITTEFVDEDRTSSHSSSTPKLNKQSVIENKPMHSEKLLAMYSSKQEHPKHSNSFEPMKETNAVKFISKNSASNQSTSPKPPLSPRSILPSVTDPNPALVRTFSNDDEDTSVGSSIYSAPPSPGPAISSSTSEANFSRPTSPDEKRSLVSTPSTSNSSLSSLSVRPTSPSGRKTPPGPKMGTNVKLGTSPTASRKATRTNIKTNPNASSLSGSKVSIKQKAAEDMPHHLIKDDHTVGQRNMGSSNEESSAVMQSNLKQADEVIPPSTDVFDQLDKSSQKCLVTNKPRHSASSVQSLESIPESENDNLTNEVIFHSSNKQNGEHSSNECQNSHNSHASLQDITEESSNGDSRKTPIIPGRDIAGHDGPKMTTKEALDNLKDAIAKEKQFANLIMRDYLEYRNDDDSSESYREPEVKEHRLELIPDCFGMMNSLTFTTDKLSQPEEKKMTKVQNGCPTAHEVKSACEPSSLSDPESSSSLSLKNTTPTHAVFQIPLKSKSGSRERSESPCPKLTSHSIAQATTPCVSSSREDNLQLTVRNITGDDEASEGGCVEGHVELNFDRGRKSEKSKDSQRHRSLSSARRQKLYDDIKKFTAETKEMKMKDTASEIMRRYPETAPKGKDSSFGLIDSSPAGRKDNLRDAMRQLSNNEKSKSARSRSTSSQRRAVNTLPRTTPKKLERSITVAEIKVNVNGKQSSPLKDPSAPPAVSMGGEHFTSNDSTVQQVKVIHGRSKSDMDETDVIERITPCGGSYPLLAGEGNLNITFPLGKIKSFVKSNSLSSENNDLRGTGDIGERESCGSIDQSFNDSIMSLKHHDFNQRHLQQKNKAKSKFKLSYSDGRLNDIRRRTVSKEPNADENRKDSDWCTVELLRKELASLQAKYEAQVENLTASLALKEEELTRTRSEATLAAEALARSHEEQQQIKTRLTKEKEEIEEKHRKEREVREREEKEKKEREDKARKEREEKEKREEEEKRKKEEEKRKKEEEEEAERKLKEEDAKKTSESEGTENEDEEKEETEQESNQRKIDKMQMEMLLLKQQNEEFEEMVREKYRRQVELELQIGEISNEVTQKESAIQSVRVELSYAKNETALTREKVKQLEEEVEEHKQRVEALEQELDTAERELKRMEILQEKLRVTETRRNDLQAQIDEIEVERDEEIKIIQDALDEAAQEREELLTTFEKEIEKLNSLNAAREAQMLQEFEDKLKELEQQHKNKLEEKEREAKTALHRNKRLADEEDVRQRLERLRSQLTSEWEDKLRSECARLKGELDSLHSEEKHLAVESIRVQKEQELQEVRKGVDGKVEALNKEISELKQSLVAKDEFYQQEIDEIRTRADRDVWELRRKLQKLDESSYDRQQHLEDKHREDLGQCKVLDRHREDYGQCVVVDRHREDLGQCVVVDRWTDTEWTLVKRLREEYADKMAGLEAQLSCVDVRSLTDLRTKLEADHKQQMEHLGEQHRLSMGEWGAEGEEELGSGDSLRKIWRLWPSYTETSVGSCRTEVTVVINVRLTPPRVFHCTTPTSLLSFPPSERLRDELEAEKVQAAEEVRVIVSKHHEYINESLKEQLADAVTSNTQLVLAPAKGQARGKLRGRCCQALVSDLGQLTTVEHQQRHRLVNSALFSMRPPAGCSVSVKVTAELYSMSVKVALELCSMSVKVALELCGMSIKVALELCGMSVKVALELCGMSVKVALELCGMSVKVTVELCGMSVKVALELCGMSVKVALELCGMSVKVTVELCRMSYLALLQKKVVVQYREEIEAIKFALSRREEVIKSLEEDVAKLRASKGSSPPAGSPPPTAGSVASSSSFQFPHEGSQGSHSSQDRLSNDTDEDGHKGSGLLGKVFGGGWFSGNRGRDSTTPAYSSPAGGTGPLSTPVFSDFQVRLCSVPSELDCQVPFKAEVSTSAVPSLGQLECFTQAAA
ncbi:hypothetical protein FHG87_005431 [Trinorchestia longiramus]|nr:hypothetical protein FHG87_005431 [Trinorchestia longiramus]